MNASQKTINAVKARAMMSTPLRKELKDWFAHKGTCPYPEITDFNKWVEKEIDFLALMLADDKIVNEDNLLVALWVEVVGDKNAMVFSKQADKEGWKTDICCYVEDGKVFSSICLFGKEDSKATEKKADAIAEKFRKLGYSASVWVDEEDEHDVTVNACLEFPLYVELVKKGGR